MPRSLDAFHDSGRVLRLAAETFFDHLSEMCEGILVVDKSARIVWVNDRWQRNIASLGFSNADEIIGRPVEEVAMSSRTGCTLRRRTRARGAARRPRSTS